MLIHLLYIPTNQRMIHLNNYYQTIAFVFITFFLCCMITMGASLLKKLSVLLAVLLCSVLTVALPVVTHAVPDKAATQNIGVDKEDVALALTAGEVSSGDAEAVLQLDKALLGQLFRTLLQQAYPQHLISPAVPAFYAFSKEDHLHTILTKGP
jgi:hypothetical protein